VIRILLGDDETLVREGFRLILEPERDLEVVGEARDGGEAVELVRRERPDVALLDIRMPGMDGIEATRRIVASGAPTRVLVLTTFDLDEYVYEAVRAGASGFLLKDVRREQLVGGIRAVVAGDTVLAPGPTRRLLEQFAQRRPGSAADPPPALAELTPRELEVLELVGRALSNREIAARLYLSEATVKTHVARILRKLGLRDRVQAVVAAYESGLAQPGETALPDTR